MPGLATLTTMSVPPRPRVILLANRDKPAVRQALPELRPWLAERATIVAEPDAAVPTESWACDLGRFSDVDLAVVLGGDGTLLAQARRLVELEVPILGVNFGKLGFLAEFSLEDLRTHWPAVAGGGCRQSRRVILDVRVLGAGSEAHPVVDRERDATLAINDVVITAGPPYRMIELELVIDDGPIPTAGSGSGAKFSGDGVIVATPTGSTAYNLSAGGPVVSPEVEAFCLTPICPHSLSFRPLVVSGQARVMVRVLEANEGTTLVLDGQEPRPLARGDRVIVRRHARRLHLLHNPSFNYWQMLAGKMHWAARPRSR